MPLTRKEFVEKYYPFVKKLTSGTGIFPETLLAQAIVESQGKYNGNYYPGESSLAKKYGNYFGIKADKSWTGPKVVKKTGEVFDGKQVVINDAFRVYKSFEDSATDYVKFLTGMPRYKKAGVFDATDYRSQIQRIKDAGYATGTNYASIVSSVADSVKQFAGGVVDTVKNNPTTTLLLIGLTFFFLTNND